MRALFILLFLGCFCLSVFAQNQFFKTYGGPVAERAWSIAQAPGNGFILCGETASFGSGNKDLLLVRTDASGDTLWMRSYGGTNEEIGEAVATTADSGFIAVGHTKSGGQGGKDVLILKIAATGALQWQRKIGGSGDEEAYSVYSCTDGSYIVAGYTSSFGATAGNMYLLKLTAAGNLSWTKIFGGPAFDGAYSVRQTSDAGFIVAGVTKSYGTGNNDATLLKTDSIGNLLWSKTYGGTNDDWGYAVKATADGGYILSGHTHSFGFTNDYDIYLIKTDSAGNLTWARCYGAAGEDIGWMVEPIADGFILAGNTEIAGVDHHNIYVLKTDTTGHLLWGKSYGAYNPAATINSDVAVSFVPALEGGYAMTGNTNSFGAGNYEAYILKTDALGNGTCLDSTLQVIENPTTTIVKDFNPTILSGGAINTVPFVPRYGGTITDICSVVAVIDHDVRHTLGNIMPNPADSFISINGLRRSATIWVMNAMGDYALQQSIEPGEPIDVSTLSPGLYILRIVEGQVTLSSQRLLIVR